MPVVTVHCDLCHRVPGRDIRGYDRGDCSRPAITLRKGGSFMTTHAMEPTEIVQKQVRADKKMSLAKIIVLTDFSNTSDLALEYTLALARRYDSHIYLTHVLPTDVYQLTDPPIAEMAYQKMRQA